MLYNCALNPLGAIFAVLYGVLGEGRYTRKIMKAVIAEIFRVVEAQGYSTHWSFAGEYLAAFYEKLFPPTAGHESSTLQDIRAGKNTEIEALREAVVRLGKKAGVEVSYNFMLYITVKFMEARNNVGE